MNENTDLHTRWFLNFGSAPLAAVLIGCGPLVYWHLMGMLGKPHYQFILLLPIAFWLLWKSLEPGSPETSFEGRWFGLVAIGTAAAGLGYATWIWSPWVAAVCCLVSVFGVLLTMEGFSLASRWMPLWVFAWILIPPPFGLDETLIVRLRTVTTLMTSALLDQFGVLHQVYANVIELPGKPLFIADACSGIHSLYVLMAMALFLSVYLRRTVLHSICLLGSTFLIVLLENVARISAVAIAWQSGMDWSMGLRHEVLGLVLFLLSTLLILSSDQLLMFLLPVDPLWFWRRVRMHLGKELVTSKNKGRSSEREALRVAKWRQRTLAISGIFPLLMVFQLTRIPAAPPIPVAFESDLRLPELGRGLLPEELNGFRLSNYEAIERVAGDPFGRSSQRWTYEKDGLSIGVSLDYPYEGVKDMTQCYENVGWKIATPSVLTLEELASAYQISDPVAPIAAAKIQRDLLGHAALLFSSFDLRGNISAMIRAANRFDADARIVGRLQAIRTVDEDILNNSNPPYCQVHLLTRSPSPITDKQMGDLIHLYESTRQIIVQKVVSSAEPTVRGKK